MRRCIVVQHQETRPIEGLRFILGNCHIERVDRQTCLLRSATTLQNTAELKGREFFYSEDLFETTGLLTGIVLIESGIIRAQFIDLQVDVLRLLHLVRECDSPEVPQMLEALEVDMFDILNRW